MKIRFLVLYVPVILAFFLSVYGCRTSLSSVRENPEDFLGHELTVSGKVGDVISIPISRFSAYMLKDNGGEVPVFSARNRKTGSSVTIRGRVIIYDSRAPREVIRETLSTIADYLVENNLSDKDVAHGLSRGVVGAIGRVSGESGSVSFILEK